MEILNYDGLANLLIVLAIAAAVAGFMAGLLGVMLLQFWTLILLHVCIYLLEHL